MSNRVFKCRWTWALVDHQPDGWTIFTYTILYYVKTGSKLTQKGWDRYPAVGGAGLQVTIMMMKVIHKMILLKSPFQVLKSIKDDRQIQPPWYLMFGLEKQVHIQEVATIQRCLGLWVNCDKARQTDSLWLCVVRGMGGSEYCSCGV